MDFLSSSLIGIQKAFVDGFKDSGITDIFKFLSSALGNSIAAAINDALGNIPGLGDLKKQAEHNRQMADVGYSTVGELLPYLDLGAGLRSFSATLEAEMQAVRDSFQRSLSDPLIDTTKLKAEADALRKEMNEIIQKNRASMEASAKKLDADLKSQQNQIPSTEGLQSSVQRATAPAVMSLTRVGGGGGPSMMGNLFAEARRQTGYLRELVKQGSTTKPLTARYS
jgi:Skp family chaperone for outer membrane proteins